MNDARVWQPVIAAMNEHQCQVADCSGHASVAALAATALACAPPGPFALAAFSLGGYVAFEILRRAPERVAALALIATSARPDTPESIIGRERMIAALENARSGAAGFDALAAAFLPRVVHASRVNDAALGDLLLSMARSVGPDGFVRQQRAAIGRPDSRPLLKNIRCKTLVLCGREDQVTPLDCSEEMASGIREAELLVLERCGHMAPLEQPDAVIRAMSRWIDAV